MTVKEIDDLARHKLDPGEGPISMLEAGLLWNLRRLYDAYGESKGVLTADEAKAEKERIITAYEADEAALSEYDRLIQQNGEMLQQLELHRKIFEQDDKRRVAISGLMCKANKNGCEICKQIARFYDGRNEV